MITLLEDMPAGVVGIRLDDDVTSDDYREVLEPALTAAESDDHKFHLVVEVPDHVPDFTLGAFGQDLKMGIKRFNDFDRVAVVTDDHALERAVPFASAFMPGEVKAWHASDRDEAITWAQRLE